MKSILIINTPEDFDYRKCSMGGDGNIYYERENEQRTFIIGNIKNLKPMPQKKEIEKCDTWREMLRAEAFNEIIDDLLGEEE